MNNNENFEILQKDLQNCTQTIAPVIISLFGIIIIIITIYSTCYYLLILIKVIKKSSEASMTLKKKFMDYFEEANTHW